MKGKLINAALFIASIVLSLLAVEVGLRAYHGEWDYANFRFPQGAAFANATALDDELGWLPEQGVQRPWGTTVTVLKDGIRSNGGGEVWDGSDRSILAVGDSFTFGNQVSDWETWPAQLERFSGRNVVNAGVFGYGIDQAFLRARRLLSRYRFSTVIFSFIPDDIRRCQMSTIFNAAKPYFDLQDGLLMLEGVPVPSEARPSARVSGPLIALEQSGLLAVLEHSRVAHSVMKRLFPQWWLAGQSSQQTQVHNEEKGRTVACALFRELERLTKSRGSELIVLAQRQSRETAAQLSASESLLSCFSDPGTRVLDLKPALAELKAKEELRYNQFYYEVGGHMTAEGNQFVALEILKFLTESQVARPPNQLDSDNPVNSRVDHKDNSQMN